MPLRDRSVHAARRQHRSDRLGFESAGKQLEAGFHVSRGILQTEEASIFRLWGGEMTAQHDVGRTAVDTLSSDIRN
jgi:hypothetical protein